MIIDFGASAPVRQEFLSRYTSEKWEEFFSSYGPGDLVEVGVTWNKMGVIVHCLQASWGGNFCNSVFISKAPGNAYLITAARFSKEQYARFLKNVANCVGEGALSEEWVTVVNGFSP